MSDGLSEQKGGERALARIRRGEPVFGLMLSIPAPTLAEMAVWIGYDFVMIDCEHGVVDEPAQVACMQAISGGNAFAAVRVRAGDLGAVGRYLDFGAGAILMADVQTPPAAAAFVAAAKHGPDGTRSSTGSTRATRYGLGDRDDGTKPLLIAIIEGAQAVSSITPIAATPGLDGLVIGPSDLSADLGCPNDFSAPAYAAAFTEIERAAAAAGRLLGCKPHAGFEVERLLAAGHTFVLAGADIAILREGYRANLGAARNKMTVNQGLRR